MRRCWRRVTDRTDLARVVDLTGGLTDMTKSQDFLGFF